MAHIFQINVSEGGVPKQPQPTGEVTINGLRGDRQRDTEHHGGPARALCLYSLEHILELQAEGHPIYPGSTGENLTIAGLDWSLVEPGTRFRVGEEVIIEITSFAAPCRSIQNSFADHMFSRISERTYPGWARAYARVHVTGTIAIGDKVEILV